MLKIFTVEKEIELTVNKQSKHEVIASDSEYFYQGESKRGYANGKEILSSKIQNNDKVKFQGGIFRKGFLVKGCIILDGFFFFTFFKKKNGHVL